MNDEHSALREFDFEPQGISLTAVDVQQQKFLIKFRGYDTEDVDAFHAVVAREMERQLNEKSRLMDELQLLQREIEMHRTKENTLNAALMNIQKTVDRMKQSAASEAEKLIARQKDELEELKARSGAECSARVSRARQEADRIMREAQQKVAADYEDAAAVKDKSVQQAIKVMDDAHAEAARIVDEGRKKINDAHESLKALKDQTLAEALKKAKDLYGQAQTLKDEAQQEATALLDDARAEITNMRQALDAQREHVTDEIKALTQRKLQFQAELKTLLIRHLNLIAQNDKPS